jgi:hypothetical protein
MPIAHSQGIAIMRAAEDAGLAGWTADPDSMFVLGPELTALRERISGAAPGALATLTPAEAEAMEAFIGME